MKINNIMPTKRRWSATTAVVALPFFLSMAGGAMALEPTEDDYELKLLGKYLFFDKISVPARQSCASCHTPDAGWTNGTSGTNQKQVAVTGANPHTVGTLKPPSNAYASFVPDFQLTPLSGGNFWNGRATGNEVRDLNVLEGSLDRYAKYLGPTADQAHASPFINPVEQGQPDIEAVCEHVMSAKYAPLYAIAFDGALIDCASDVATTFGRFAVALSAYQHSSEVNAFDSKRDRALANDSDGEFPLDGFTDQENLGHDLFYNVTSDLNPEGKRANCRFCHQNGNRTGTSPDERYTNDAYRNIGTPRNVEIPGNPEPNPGVATTTGDDGDLGRHKVPTLRNVDKRRGNGFKKAYAHNGWFKSLESIVHFYNTRDAKPACESGATEKEALAQGCWPAAEFPGTQAGFIMGDLGLTADEEAALVAYMKALTDIPTAKAPVPFNLKKFEKGELR
jgi:cytochrome c peroxidase